jgi:glycosyltransferase involved in cell wall biosynthesis
VTGPQDSPSPGDRAGHITIVVPCHNEARRLRTDVFAAYALRHQELHFIFVNDGSSDETATVLEGLHRDLPGQVTAVHLPANRGKAEAVRQGVQAALRSGSEYVGYWDADLATPLEAIHDLTGAFTGKPSVELVMGSRVRLMGRTIHRRALRHYVGRVFATAASLTLGIPVYDTQCGAKVFRVTSRTATLFDQPFVSRWVFDVELIARRLEGFDLAARSRAGELMIEYPLMQWEDVAGSKVRMVDLLVAFWGLARIAFRYRLRARVAAAPTVAG